MELRLSQFDYPLPPELIAQAPCDQRDHSRLLVFHRREDILEHRIFNQVLDYLKPGDILVVNNTRVIPARLMGQKKTGGKVECLVLNYPNGQESGSFTSACLIKARRKIQPGECIFFNSELEGEMLPTLANGTAMVRFSFSGPFETILQRVGSVPLPPYIRRDRSEGNPLINDETRYQTVYAEDPGAVAAPTAGLHFTDDLLDAIKKLGISVVPVTLHVGYGTFAPVKSENIHDHKIHSEVYKITEEAANLIQEKKRAGGRVIAVGTTSVRVLEYLCLKYGALKAAEGACDLFITPGFQFKMVDGLITNFHLPKTTLMLLVSALAGREGILKAYREAIAHGYRFYSYGDAMLII
jgi:S-adenosylmethionine:tRNA ribosyltransferase-isomerase